MNSRHTSRILHLIDQAQRFFEDNRPLENSETMHEHLVEIASLLLHNNPLEDALFAQESCQSPPLSQRVSQWAASYVEELTETEYSEHRHALFLVQRIAGSLHQQLFEQLDHFTVTFLAQNRPPTEETTATAALPQLSDDVSTIMLQTFRSCLSILHTRVRRLDDPTDIQTWPHGTTNWLYSLLHGYSLRIVKSCPELLQLVESMGNNCEASTNMLATFCAAKTSRDLQSYIFRYMAAHYSHDSQEDLDVSSLADSVLQELRRLIQWEINWLKQL